MATTVNPEIISRAEIQKFVEAALGSNNARLVRWLDAMQQAVFNTDANVLPDTFTDVGPSAVISATGYTNSIKVTLPDSTVYYVKAASVP